MEDYKKDTLQPYSTFSRFFSSASSREKKIFSKAARMANEDQRQLFDAEELSKVN